MNREGFESSTESECGGMYSKAARGRSKEIMWDVQTDVNYKCGIKAPAKSNTRRKVRVKEKLVDKKPKRSKVDRRRREGKSAGDRMSREVQASKETFEDAPVWWQLEVEGHSYNRRNKNRVRRYLQKMLDHLEANEEIPEKVKRKERQRRRVQLEALQRPRRRNKNVSVKRKGGRKRRQA